MIHYKKVTKHKEDGNTGNERQKMYNAHRKQHDDISWIRLYQYYLHVNGLNFPIKRQRLA